MATLAKGSAGAKLIGLASLPVITRLYAPADMGALSVFAAFLMLLAPLLTLQYNRGLPVPRGDAAAANLLILCLGLVLGLSGVLWAALWAAAGPVLGLVSMDALLPVWWMLPFGAAIFAVFSTLQLWATRRRTYRVMAEAEIGQSLAGNGAKIALAFAMPAPFGLVVGHVIAQGGGILWYLFRFNAEFKRLFRHVRLRRIRAMALRYRGFPQFRMPSQLLLLISAQAPVIFIAAVYGPATAGQFGLALLALSMPMNLIGRSMGKAFFGEAAHLGRSDSAALRRSVLEVTRVLAAFGAVIAIALLLLAPPLFPLIFGQDWSEAGRFAATLSIYLAFQFAAAPVMTVLSVLGREVVYLQLNLQRLVLMALLFTLAIALGLTAIQLIVVYSVVMALHFIVCYLKVLRELGRPE